MFMRSYQPTILYLSFLILSLFSSCDDGKIYDDIKTDSSQTGSVVRVSANIKGADSWPSSYSVVVAGFGEGEYANISKGVIVSSAGDMNMVMSGIPTEGKTVELCVINQLRKRIVSFYSSEIQYQEDTIIIDAGTIDAGMFSSVQREIFDKTCINCHGKSTTPAGNLFLTEGKSYDALVNVPASLSDEGMPYVTPGKVDSSFLHLTLNTDISANWHMDHLEMITQKDLLNLLDDWIGNGAKK